MSESKAAIGFAGAFLSFALVFRTNVCYSQWWEGHCLWGAIITHSFDASQQASCWILDRDLETRFQRAIILFAWSSKAHLRNNKLKDDAEEGKTYYFELDAIVTQPGWQPYYCLDIMREVVNLAMKNDQITSESMKMSAIRAFADSIKGLSKGTNGANRVKTTGLPVSYNLFLLSFLYTFFFFATLVWSTTIGWYTIIVFGGVLLIAIMVVYLGDAIENPFGTDLSDLPLRKYCQGVVKHVHNVHAEYKVKFDIAVGPEYPAVHAC